MMERAPDRGRNRACPRADLHDLPVRVVPHDHPRRVARQPLAHFRRNAGTAVEHGLACCVGVGQHRGVDVDDDLIALARSTGVELVVQGGLGDERKAIGLLLLHGRRVGLAGVGPPPGP
jgi:hypothetical protein